MAADVQRIQEMEARLDACAAAVSDLQTQLDRMDALRADMIALFQYYGSEAWYGDREADLPENIRAGVLSEDSVYDVITDARDAAFHMLELAADMLKNRI